MNIGGTVPDLVHWNVHVFRIKLQYVPPHSRFNNNKTCRTDQPHDCKFSEGQLWTSWILNFKVSFMWKTIRGDVGIQVLHCNFRICWLIFSRGFSYTQHHRPCPPVRAWNWWNTIPDIFLNISLIYNQLHCCRWWDCFETYVKHTHPWKMMSLSHKQCRIHWTWQECVFWQVQWPWFPEHTK